MKTTGERLADGNGYVIPAVISAGLIASALVEVFEYLAARPNLTILTAMVIYFVVNNLFIYFKLKLPLN